MMHSMKCWMRYFNEVSDEIFSCRGGKRHVDNERAFTGVVM